MSKIIWIVVIVVIAAAAFFYFQSSPQTAVSPSAPSYAQPAPSGAANAPSATHTPSDNPDTIVSNLLNETSRVAPTPSEADPSLVAPSTDISGSFDQSLNASQF